MITSRPWFGPKKYLGWGWTPITWEGWLATAVFLIAFLVCFLVIGGGPGVAAGLVLMAAYLGVVVLTGTKPGGPAL